jgi:hypothetical protein
MTVLRTQNEAEHPEPDHTYDSEGQRTRTVLVEDYEDTAANQTQTTTDYLYDGLKLISETITRQVGEESPEVRDYPDILTALGL